MIKFRQLFSFKQKEIDDAFKVASLSSSILGLKLLHSHNPSLEYGKLLIITPRACGNATERNTIRRQLKNIFYEQKLYKNPGIWIVIVYKNAMRLDFDKLKSFLVKGTG